MNMLDNCTVKCKMLIALAASMGFMLLIGIVSVSGLKSQRIHINGFFNENYASVKGISDYLNKVEGARVALVTMLATGNGAKVEVCGSANVKDLAALREAVILAKASPEKLNPLRDRISSISVEATAILDEVYKAQQSDDYSKKKVDEIRETWRAFVKTRDTELIPLIYDGKIEDANKIGLGIQAERYKKFTSLARELMESEGKEAESVIKEINASGKRTVIVMVIITVFAMLFGSIVMMVISNNISRRIGLIADASELMAEGKLGNRVDISGTDEIGVLSASFNKMSQNLQRIISDISEAANHIASASQQLSTTSEQMNKGMGLQTSQTAQIASAMEEMSATVLEVAKNAQGAASSAKEAAETAKKGGSVVDQTIKGMERIAATVQESARTIGELGKSSDRIGEIVTVIYDIADQTNLLALNAAIEAARAGEQGRGFAVVADEVRKLAERTTKATKEIGEMIKSIQKETEGAVGAMEAGTSEVADGVNLANKAGESLNMIVVAIDKVNEMISQIATASEQQSSAAEEISTSVEGVAGVTRESAVGLKQSASASQDLASMAVQLKGIVGQFSI